MKTLLNNAFKVENEKLEMKTLSRYTLNERTGLGADTYLQTIHPRGNLGSVFFAVTKLIMTKRGYDKIIVRITPTKVIESVSVKRRGPTTRY